MKTVVHPLLAATPGASHQLTSLHFGPVGRGRKVYIQAALHADETPAMLVAHVLRGRLEALEAAGRLDAQIVLVPSANPIGLGQNVLGGFTGRFELSSGKNFNRGFPFVLEQVAAAVEGRLGDDAPGNLAVIRAAWREALEACAPGTAYESLHQTLMLLAHDADINLDLHCSREAALHVYTGEAIWPEVEPLARYLGSRAQLLALDAGGHSFDEAHSLVWHELQARFGARHPIPHGSIAVTVEHRGQRDVRMDWAEADAQALLDYLTHTGDIRGEAPPLPPLQAPATPLAGSEQFKAPMSGVLVYRAEIGANIEVGQALVDIIEPVSGASVTITSHTAGVFYMGRDVRYVRLGDPVGRVSGAEPLRTGNLLSA